MVQHFTYMLHTNTGQVSQKMTIRRADPNIIALQFNKLLMPKIYHTGDPFVCSNGECTAVLSHLSCTDSMDVSIQRFLSSMRGSCCTHYNSNIVSFIERGWLMQPWPHYFCWWTYILRLSFQEVCIWNSTFFLKLFVHCICSYAVM